MRGSREQEEEGRIGFADRVLVASLPEPQASPPSVTPALRNTYRGWDISQGGWPLPAWMATGPNYEAWTEGDGWQDNGEKADARTREALIAEIDAWFEEQAA